MNLRHMLSVWFFDNLKQDFHVFDITALKPISSAKMEILGGRVAQNIYTHWSINRNVIVLQQ